MKQDIRTSRLDPCVGCHVWASHAEGPGDEVAENVLVSGWFPCSVFFSLFISWSTHAQERHIAAGNRATPLAVSKIDIKTYYIRATERSKEISTGCCASSLELTPLHQLLTAGDNMFLVTRPSKSNNLPSFLVFLSESLETRCDWFLQWWALHNRASV